MKHFSIICLFVFFVLFSNACKKNEPVTSPGNPLVFTTSEKSVLGSTNSFGINLLTQLGDTATANLFLSPFSISLDLTMAYNGAEGNTAQQMQQVLGYQQLTKTGINKDCQTLIQSIEKADANVTLAIANSIWYRNTMTVTDSFINLNKTYFSAQVNAADFSNPGTVGLINNWAAINTNQKITTILNSIDSSEMLFLINAIYFQGNWKYAFSSSLTSNANFYCADGSAYSTPFMHQTGSFKCMGNNLFNAAELPYGNGDFSMVVMVPAGSNTVQTILSNLSLTTWNAWNDSLDTQSNVRIELPKFDIANKFSLCHPLQNMGMTDAFNPIEADFSGINGTGGLYISNVMHFSYISVDEKGTTAAAVTTTTVSTTSVPAQNFMLVANKPFLYFIKENTTNTILFEGIVEKPEVTNSDK